MELNISYENVSDLKPYQNNAKIHTEEQIGQIAESIRQFGMNDPIAVWKNGEIIEGHGRLEACKRLGMKKVPVIHLDSMTDEERRAYMLIHNKLTVDTGFQFDILTEELEGIDGIDMSVFGFDVDDESWFENRQRYEGKQEGNDEYNEFLEKFEVKKTTDDCYTPDGIYDLIASYVEKTYNVDRKNFVRPFYPNGDYEKEKYKPTDIVVDNPPFSIISKIISFYADNGIKFFLFAPSLTGFSTAQIEKSTTIATGATITYENGAKVSTSFVTNLEGDYIVRTDPVLLKDVEEMDAKIRKEKRVELPKYEYPSYIVTMAMMCTWAKYGIWFKVPRGQGVQIQALDAQKEEGKGIFGGGILLSEKARIEAEKARKPQVYELSEREQTIVWELSDREQTIVWELSDRES